MNIQSLSICIPTHNTCVNKCAFCVSRTHTNPYEDRINDISKSFCEGDDNIVYNQVFIDYLNRLEYARDNGCNVVVLTGTGEPIQNKHFLDFFHNANLLLDSPFKSIELQTTGVKLNTNWNNIDEETTLAHLRKIGITTISFSISNIFDNERNLSIIGCAPHLTFDVFETIKLVKKYDFNLRLSLNLVSDYDKYSVDDVLARCKELGADQVTFRKLYKSELNNSVDQWIEKNTSVWFYDRLVDRVTKTGKFLGYLPFGPKMYNIDEMSVCIDSDCMANEVKDTFKYLILRENCHVYFKWETKSSLIF